MSGYTEEKLKRNREIGKHKETKKKRHVMRKHVEARDTSRAGVPFFFFLFFFFFLI